MGDTSRSAVDESRRERWERATEIPLTVSALIFLVAYAWPILDPSIDDGRTGIVFTIVTLGAWGFFAVDYAMRLRLSRQRGRFVRTHVIDLLAVVVPLLRPLRLLRLITVLGVLNRASGSSLRGRVVVYAIGGTVLVLVVASLAMLDAERQDPAANIRSFGDALWWAMTTVTTVGYGDHFPITLQGRFIAGALMVGGIALLGVITASFASWLVERVAEVEEASQAATRRDIEVLTAEVALLRRLLEAREPETRP